MMLMKNIKERKFIIICLVIISVIAIALVPKVLQNDTFYTIKIGKYILKYGIDMKDHFSNIANLPYTYPHFLFDVIVALFYNLGGFNGTYVLTIILTVILAITLYFIVYKLYKEPLISLFISLLVLWIIMPFIALRAQLVTYTLFIILIYNIFKFLETKKIKHVIVMFSLAILIANFHAAVWPLIFILFLPFLVEQLVFYFAKKIKSKNKLTNFLKYKFEIKYEPNIKYLFLIFILLLFTGLITPICNTPYLYTIKIFLGETTKLIHEHSLSLLDSKLYICTLLVPLILFFIFKKKLRLRDVFMLSGLLILSITSRRHIALLATIGSLFIAKYIIEFYKKYSMDFTKIAINYITKPIIAIIFTAFLIVPYIPMLISKINADAVDKSEYPVNAVTFLKKQYQVKDIKIFNDYNFGSYLMLYDTNPIIDSRSDLYTKPFNKKFDYFNEYIDFDHNYYVDYQNYFEKYNINFVVVKLNSYLNIHLLKDSNYHVVYFDEYFYVYKKIEH